MLSLADQYASSPSRNPWKTFVLEAHAEYGAERLLQEGFEQNCVERTEDIYLHHLAGEVEFMVDHDLTSGSGVSIRQCSIADAMRCLPECGGFTERP